MKVIETQLPEVWVLEPRVFGDERGFFMESFNQRAFDMLLQQAAIGQAGQWIVQRRLAEFRVGVVE